MNRPGKHLFHPGLEALEGRWCPTCTVNLNPDTGVLRIVGTNAANSVEIIQDHGASDMTVKCDGEQDNFVPDEVKKIVVILKGGADVFTYRIGGGSDFEDAMILSVKLGKGADQATFNLFDNGDLNGVATIKQNLTVGVFGGFGSDQVDAQFGAIDSAAVVFKGNLHAGKDTFQAAFKGDLLGSAAATLEMFGLNGQDQLSVVANSDDFSNDATGIDIAAGASLSLTLRGGQGLDEVLDVTYQGIVDGQLKVVTGGGSAGDTSKVNLTADAGSDGSLDGLVRGKRGPDDLTFNLVDNSGGTLTIVRAIVQGDQGADTLTSTPNVTQVP
jgi:hypothetical protein